jgi:hypothetical protein
MQNPERKFISQERGTMMVPICQIQWSSHAP